MRRNGVARRGGTGAGVQRGVFRRPAPRSGSARPAG